MDLTNFLSMSFIPAGMLLALKIIFIAISLFFVAGIAFFLKQTNWLGYRYTQDLQDFLSFRASFAKKFEKMFKKINKRLDSQSVGEHKLALIEVDNLLGEVLDKMKYKGRDIEDKLVGATDGTISNIQEIKDVRKIINNIMNDPDYNVSLDRARSIVKVYEKALQDLNII